LFNFSKPKLEVLEHSSSTLELPLHADWQTAIFAIIKKGQDVKNKVKE